MTETLGKSERLKKVNGGIPLLSHAATTLSQSTNALSSRPLDNCSFYIIGTKRFQSDLLAYCLGRKAGKQCHVIESPHVFLNGTLVNDGHPKLILWDCQGKDIKGLLTELKTYLRPEKCFKRVILFNVPPMLEFIKPLTSLGIRGFFYEHDSKDNFLKGIQAVLEGKLWLSREIMEKSIFEGTDDKRTLKGVVNNITEREIEILALVAVGSTNEEIADKLCISPHTVKTHIYKIFKKINVPNRVQASLWAAKNL